MTEKFGNPGFVVPTQTATILSTVILLTMPLFIEVMEVANKIWFHFVSL